MRFLIIFIVVAAAALLFLRMRDRQGRGGSSGDAVKAKSPAKRVAATTGKARSAAPKNPWSATSIVPGGQACAAAQAIGGKRFLDKEGDVPLLPLADCDAANCECRYARHEDRRRTDGDRRLPGAALRTELYEDTGNKNRRSGRRGRRKTDWE